MVLHNNQRENEVDRWFDGAGAYMDDDVGTLESSGTDFAGAPETPSVDC